MAHISNVLDMYLSLKRTRKLIYTNKRDYLRHLKVSKSSFKMFSDMSSTNLILRNVLNFIFLNVVRKQNVDFFSLKNQKHFNS